MKKMLTWQACICVMLAFMSMNAGPTDEEAQNSAQIQTILRQDRGGVLRGVHFNMPMEEVTATETGKCLKTENELLMFAIKESSSTTFEHIKLSYEFENNRLYFVTVESTEKDSDSAILLYRNLKDHYDKTYGEGQCSQNGMTTWCSIDKKTGIAYDIMCELQDSSVVIKYYVI